MSAGVLALLIVGGGINLGLCLYFLGELLKLIWLRRDWQQHYKRALTEAHLAFREGRDDDFWAYSHECDYWSSEMQRRRSTPFFRRKAWSSEWSRQA